MAMKRKILIAGGSGLVGSRLIEYLGHSQYHFNILSRRERPDKAHVSYFQWDTDSREIDLECLSGVSVVINLAGAGIADKRWTKTRKKEILHSRVDSILTLGMALEESGQKPPLYIGASAVGYYGDQGAHRMEEKDVPGSGFLAEVTKEWEETHHGLVGNFHRHVLLRIGIVLSTQGGALVEILKPAKAGVYGYFGNGSSYYSWVHIDDICEMIKAAIEDEKYSGIYNATAPEPITIKELVKAVKEAKDGTGLVIPIPIMGLKLALGEMTQMLTDSMRAIPQALLDQGHIFLYPDPVAALKDILERRV